MRESDTMPEDVTERLGLPATNGKVPGLTGRVLLARAIEDGIEPPEELEPDTLLRGRVHSIYAGSGTGKTMLMLFLTARALERGERVAIFDMENGPRIISERLWDMGVSLDRLDDLLRYFYHPPLTLEREAVAAYTALLDEFRPDLIIFDSWINFLATCGLDENVSGDIATWAVSYTHPARERGTSVLLLDHVPHENARARGSSRKRDEVDVMWKLANPLPFDRDTVGEIVLHREKDREGWLPMSVGFSVGGGEAGFIFRRSSGTIEQPDTDGLTDRQRQLFEHLQGRGSEGAPWRELEFQIGSKSTLSRTLAELRRWNLVTKRNSRYYVEPKNRTDKPETDGSTEFHNGSTEPTEPGETEGVPPVPHPKGWNRVEPDATEPDTEEQITF